MKEAGMTLKNKQTHYFYLIKFCRALHTL